MFRYLILSMLAPVFAIAASNWAEAGHHRCHKCCAAAAPCDSCNSSDNCTAAEPAFQEVEKTVMVPTIVTEMRKIAVTKHRNEERTRYVTITKNVLEVKTRDISKTVMIPEVRTRKIEYTERKAVTTEKEISYTVKVPQTLTRTIRCAVKKPVRTEREVTCMINVATTEERTGTRKVCKLVPVTKTKTITEDQGHWETQAVPQTLTADKGSDCDPNPAGCCGDRASEAVACTKPKRVWVPNMVTRDLEITCNEKTFEDQQYTYNVTVYKPEARTRKVVDFTVVNEECTRDVPYTVCQPETRTKTVQVVSYINEPKTREEQYTVMTPQVKTSTEEYTVIKQVPETRTESYTVKVPYTEEQEVPTKVCRLVAKTIKVRVAAPCGAATPAAPCCK